ncbi:hypothetical protein vseg_015466 [Gypsophila vaccaria]
MAGDGTEFIKVGPLGAPRLPREGDVSWDGKGISKITCIFISFHDDRLASFQYQYVEDGSTKLSPVYGQHMGATFTTVEFKYADEYITGLSGEYDEISGDLETMRFKTNLKKYGPFGTSCCGNAAKFNFQFGPANRFGGFYGTIRNHPRDGMLLSSIGVYVRPKPLRQ